MRRLAICAVALATLLPACGGSHHSSSESLPSGRAIPQSAAHSRAALRFYDWEPNVYSGPNKLVDPSRATDSSAPDVPIFSLFAAVHRGAASKPRAEASDIPAHGPDPAIATRFNHDMHLIERYYDRRNDSAGNKYYLFGPAPGSGQNPRLIVGPAGSCPDLLSRYRRGSAGRRVTRGTRCADELTRLGTGGPPQGSTVLEVPTGVVIIGAQPSVGSKPGSPPPGYFVVEDDSALSGLDITDPKQQTDVSGRPDVTFGFSAFGREQFAAVTRRIAQRGASQLLAAGRPAGQADQRFAITLDNRIISLASVDFREHPDGIDGRTGAEINGIGSIQEAAQLAARLR